MFDSSVSDWYNKFMDDNKKLKKKIVASIRDDFSKKFRVIDNTSGASRSFNGVFPDVILMQPEPPKNDTIFFIMKIEENENSDLLDSAPIWKLMSDTPFVPYIVISEKRATEAKKIIQALGLKLRIATFVIDYNGKAAVRYE